jgi:hypothetical protein
LDIYVQPFSCKKNEYNIFKKIVLDSAAGNQKKKDTLIEMVKLAYTLQGKGKNRKRSLTEILEIINDKSAYFKKAEALIKKIEIASNSDIELSDE